MERLHEPNRCISCPATVHILWLPLHHFGQLREHSWPRGFSPCLLHCPAGSQLVGVFLHCRPPPTGNPKSPTFPLFTGPVAEGEGKVGKEEDWVLSTSWVPKREGWRDAESWDENDPPMLRCGQHCEYVANILKLHLTLYLVLEFSILSSARIFHLS